MILKLNLPVPKSSEAVKYYAEIFQAEIIKPGKGDGHAYIKLFNKISLHVHSRGKMNMSNEYHILRFEDSEKDLYTQTVKTISERVDLEITRKDKEMT